MHTAAKHLHRLGQVGSVGQCDQRLLLAQILHIFQRDRLALPSFLGQLIEGSYVLFFGVCKADDKEEVCVQVAVVEGADCMAGACVFAKQDDIGRARLDEELWLSAVSCMVGEVSYTRGILDACVQLGEAYNGRVYNLAQSNTLPIAAVEPGISRSGRRIVDQVLESLLREGGLSRRAR